MSNDPVNGSPQYPILPPQGAAPAASLKGNGWGITALVLGIIAFVFAFIPMMSYAAIGLGAIGLICAIVGLLLKGRRKGATIAGLIISVIALILAIIMSVFYTSLFFAVNKVVNDSNKNVTIQYSVTGTAQDVSVTYGSASGIEQLEDAALPWTKSVTDTGLNASAATVTAQTSSTTGGDIECKIVIDGKTISDKKSSGAAAIVTCTAASYSFTG